MKRREILKMLGVGTLSLVGIERLAKAMAQNVPSPTETQLCLMEGTDVACAASVSNEGYTPLAPMCPILVTCPASATCNDGSQHSCKSFECLTVFTCEPPTGSGDFNCISQFQGCGGMKGFSFRCKGTDLKDAQFNCSVVFTGCQGDGAFRCDDFDCVNTYDCGSGKVCPTPGRFACENPPHGRFSCPNLYNS